MSQHPAARVSVLVRESGGARDGDRALLITEISTLLRIRPTTVSISQNCADCGGDHGQPLVTLEDDRLHGWVSLARARGRVAIAASSVGPVGVDIEVVTAVAAQPLDAFGAVELAAIRESSHPARVMTQLWTAKESLLKADGRGLRCDPRDVEFRVADPGSSLAPELDRWLGGRVEPREVHLQHFEPAAGVIGTVTVFGPIRPRFTIRTGEEAVSRRSTDG